MLLKPKVSIANLQPRLSNDLIPKGKFKGLNWTMEAVSSFSTKEAAVVEGAVVAGLTLVGSFSSPSCCSWITSRSLRSTFLLESIVPEMMMRATTQVVGC